jgi:hypothetical protein
VAIDRIRRRVVERGGNTCPESGMRTYGFAIALLVLASPFAAALAAEIEIPPRRSPDHVTLQNGPPNRGRWTDGCANCSRDDKDEHPICSNPGIACQPKPIACLTPAASQKK